MDKQLSAPLLIEPLGPPTKISTRKTFTHLSTFVEHLPPSPQRTQLERLADALGVEVGAIAPSEGEAREKKREAERAAARLERRRTREAARAAEAAAAEDLREADKDALEAAIEGEAAAEDEDAEEEEGLGGNLGEGPIMDDRGDVEYGDVPEDDQDEPDNEHAEMEED
ncbi:hypothetical protein CspeluHIS016_0304610 [Cutaneotrichosporon spelunceum]|uniref:Uncharacterized protein n=1 Tax=Cutaneotrichosporon spelunceum TaxID=1672016 RepID=A0AAD3TTG4_9TREE|nr:hypothetical protein CspeluHIS016_0304610 [Cutaneotrichosporon spelunceum]